MLSTAIISAIKNIVSIFYFKLDNDMQKNIFLLFLVIILTQSLYSQSSISGKITDQQNTPLIAANIYISDLNKGTTSDKNGYFELSDLPLGKIRIQFSYIGYTSRIEIINLSSKQQTINIELRQSAIEAEEIVVTGGYNATQHNTAVKIDVLKLNNSNTQSSSNLMEILTKVPGVDMISKGNGVAKPVIRGLSLNDVLVLNNGVRLENYQFSAHHPLGVDEFGIETVEIIKGPASLLYGSDAIGGVINFLKEKPAEVGTIKGDYGMQLFSNSLGMMHNLGIKGAGKNLYGGLRFGNTNQSDYLQGGGEFVPNTRFYGNSLKMSTGYNNSKMSLNFFYDYSKYKVGLAEEEAIDYIKAQGRGRDFEVFYMPLNNQMLSMRNKIFLNKFKLEINAAYQNASLIHFEGLNDIAIDMNLQTYTYETRLYFPSTNKSEYIVGLQGLHQMNKNNNNREIILLPDALTDNYSAFGLVQYSLWGRLKIQAGIRYDDKQIVTDAVNLPTESNYRPALSKYFGSFSGSLGATFTATENLFLKFNFASAFRNPTLSELTSNGLHETIYEIGNQSLMPEKAYETDISIHYHTDNITFDVAAFNNQLKQYIYLSPTANSTNEGVRIYEYRQTDAHLYGFEAGFHVHPQNYEWLHFETTFSSVVGKNNAGGYLPFIPANKINSECRVEKHKLGILYNPFFKLSMTTALAQNSPALDEAETDAYSLFNIGLGSNIQLFKHLVSLGLSANNLFDKKYVDHLSTLKEVNYFNPGRNISLSLKIPFGIQKSQYKK